MFCHANSEPTSYPGESASSEPGGQLIRSIGKIWKTCQRGARADCSPAEKALEQLIWKWTSQSSGVENRSKRRTFSHSRGTGTNRPKEGTCWGRKYLLANCLLLLLCKCLKLSSLGRLDPQPLKKSNAVNKLRLLTIRQYSTCRLLAPCTNSITVGQQNTSLLWNPKQNLGSFACLTASQSLNSRVAQQSKYLSCQAQSQAQFLEAKGLRIVNLTKWQLSNAWSAPWQVSGPLWCWVLEWSAIA